MITISFTMPVRVRKELKVKALQKNITMTELLIRGFKVIMKDYPEFEFKEKNDKTCSIIIPDDIKDEIDAFTKEMGVSRAEMGRLAAYYAIGEI